MYSKSLIDKIMNIEVDKSITLTYRGIHFRIIKVDKPIQENYQSKLLEISKFVLHLDRGTDDNFLEDDTWHVWNAEQTSSEKIRYLLDKAIRNIEDLLTNQVKEYKQELRNIKEKIAFINAWNSNNVEDTVKVEK